MEAAVFGQSHVDLLENGGSMPIFRPVEEADILGVLAATFALTEHRTSSTVV